MTMLTSKIQLMQEQLQNGDTRSTKEVVCPRCVKQTIYYENEMSEKYVWRAPNEQSEKKKTKKEVHSGVARQK